MRELPTMTSTGACKRDSSLKLCPMLVIGGSILYVDHIGTYTIYFLLLLAWGV